MRQFDLVSDLHLDYYPEHSLEFASSVAPTSRVLVIAGDAVNGLSRPEYWEGRKRVFQTLKDKYSDVVFVLGNHDYYYQDFARTLASFKNLEAEVPGFHCLENEVKEVGGIVFAGTTLWFKRSPFYERFTDFQLIANFKRDIYSVNDQAISFLRSLKKQSVDVIITHHLPSYRSVHEHYRNATNNIYYVCDVEKEMAYIQPKVWCHGHTHEFCDYEFMGTRVVCHPRGYPFEPNHRGYQPKLVEIP